LALLASKTVKAVLSEDRVHPEAPGVRQGFEVEEKKAAVESCRFVAEQVAAPPLHFEKIANSGPEVSGLPVGVDPKLVRPVVLTRMHGAVLEHVVWACATAGASARNKRVSDRSLRMILTKVMIP
jgi:hypothetical protein